MKRLRAWAMMLVGAVAIFGVVANTMPVSAAGTNLLTVKALMEEVYRCYTAHDHFDRSEQILEDFNGYNTIVKNDGKASVPSIITGNWDETDCRKLMIGEGNFSGVLSMAGLSYTVKGANAETLLKTLSYSVDKADNKNGACYRMKFTLDTGTVETNRACFDDDGVSVRSDNSGTKNDNYSFASHVSFSSAGSSGVTLKLSVDQSLQDGKLPSSMSGCSKVSGGVKCTTSKKGEEAANEVLDQFVKYIYALGNGTGGNYDPWRGANGKLTYTYGTTDKITIQAAGSNVNDLFTKSSVNERTYSMMGSKVTNAESAIKKLSSAMGNEVSYHSALKFTKDEKFAFFQNHMVDYWGVSGENLKCDDLSAASSGEYEDIKMLVNGEVKQCKAKPKQGTENNLIWAFNGDYFSSTKLMSFAEVAEWMDKNGDAVNADDIDDLTSSMASGTTDDDAGEKDINSLADVCFDNSGAIGWLVCPILTGVEEIMNSAYTNWIEPLLKTSPGLMSALQVNGGNGVYDAWGIFRDIANVMFVLVFMVVIFSQVTGFGIDNYGIKRTLPRLIISAILVNFSFLICQLAVDVSNILGSGLNNLMTAYANNVSLPNISGASGAGTTAQLLLGGIMTAALAVAVAGAVTGLAFILPIFMALISGIISLFFGFILLGVRQAAIIILVVTSPIMFVLYMLPNMSNLFTKWRRMFVNLLLVYPAAGLLVGGGYFASRVILSVDESNFIFQIIGMLLLCIPYFFIIPLVKSSLSAMGNLGNKISAFGQGLSRGATGAMRNSEAYKAFDKQLRTAGTKPGRNGRAGWRTRLANTKAGQIAGLDKTVARQGEAWEAEEQRQIAAGVYNDANMDPDDSDDHLRERFLNAKTNRERSIIAARWEKSNRKGFVDNMALMAAAGNLDGEWAKNHFQNSKESKQLMEKRNPYADLYVATGARNGAMFDENGKLNPAYTKDLKDEDVNDMSTDALRMGVAGGHLGDEQVHRVMTSAVPKLQQGIQSDAGKASVLQPIADAYADGATDAQKSAGVAAKAAAQKKLDNSRAQQRAIKAGSKVLRAANGKELTGANGSAIEGYVPEGFQIDAAYSKNGVTYVADAAGNMINTKTGASVNSSEVDVGGSQTSEILSSISRGGAGQQQA